jgi:glycosyltransferase involved in cell wall biosynthesis
MWEYLDESATWLMLVDLILCPTRICRDVAIRLRERLGLDYEVELLPWPVDLDAFPFHPRKICERFLFINGNGGSRERWSNRPRWDGRKGVKAISEAARLAPGVPIIVRSQTDRLPPFPANVDVRIGEVDNPADLYLEGDVCIQPSRWEGFGLPLLECQASGLPLITTDAPPMNEHRPLRAVPGLSSFVPLAGCRPIRSIEVEPAALARVLVEVHGSNIAEASFEARRFIETEHSWKVRADPLLQTLRTLGNRISK